MGACSSCCCCVAKTVIAVHCLLHLLNLHFTLKEWREARSTGTIEELKETLNDLGSDLSKIPVNELPESLDNAVFICCNTYKKLSYRLGVGPMNDSINVATYLHDIGHTVYYLHNPTSDQFIEYLKYFLSHTKKHLTVYYTGHGASIDDVHGDESDGKDECMVFEDKFIVDDDLADILAQYKTNPDCKTLLLTDCCHSGSIWDIQSGNFNGRVLPPNVMSISAAEDEQTSKQTKIDGTYQGIFTFYFFKLLLENPNYTPKELEKDIKPYLNQFEQCYVVATTSESMLNEPIFSN
ncbi:hypothetical protein M9Y10_013190 [Tritrichomonas musculus]|uniref:Peptidase C14 caspase domain-containing protein n=1 Tax=Tritrichomonas musculus TaxID=1915356 RepID=A0ABR2I6R1_9EUKA